MKKLLILLFIWLSCHSIFAQNNSTRSIKDSQSITTTGTILPQLITTNINRSNLQFGVDLSRGLESPNLSVNFQKFISDEKKQLTITGGTNLSHSFSFRSNDNFDFYAINNISLNLGADLKLFNDKNYFVQFGTQNSVGKQGGISDFDHINTRNSLTLAIGKGRIDFVSDGAAALVITEKLTAYGLLQRDLSEKEYSLLVQKINTLKNRRKYVNRSYPLTEAEEIQDFLITLGAVDQKVDITAIINDAYKYEPMIDRTTGSQFRIAVEGSYFHSNFFSALNSKILSGTLSYHIHSAINSDWQYNKGISGYIVALESNFDDPAFFGNKIRTVGIGFDNDIHYLIDNRIRLSFLTTIGYNFINSLNSFDPTGNPYYENDGFYLRARTELDFQISRTMSATFGINLNISLNNIFTGLNLGLNF